MNAEAVYAALAALSAAGGSVEFSHVRRICEGVETQRMKITVRRSSGWGEAISVECDPQELAAGIAKAVWGALLDKAPR